MIFSKKPAFCKSIFPVICSFSIFACTTTTPPPPAPGLKKLINNELTVSFDDSQEINILVATNRKTAGNILNCSSENYTIEWQPNMSYASCLINVPRRHAVGSIEPVSSGNKDVHNLYSMLDHRTLTQESLIEKIKGAKQVALFVHGFNVRFDEAVLRAAQLAYDAKFQGPVILFSWPAGGGDGMLNSIRFNRTYEKNRDNAKLSIEQFRSFVHELSKSGTQINLVVHSMGHQVVVPALVDESKIAQKKPIFNEVIFNAPDIETAQIQAAANQIRTLAERVTLYCSPNDNALIASNSLNGNSRAGQCAKVDGFDVINVRDVESPSLGFAGLGHGYYAGRIVLTDVFQTFLGIDAPKRLFIRKADDGGAENFMLRP